MAPFCDAKGKTGKPCQRPAGWGTVHPGHGNCKLHSGSTPNGIQAAQKQAARQAVVKLGLLANGEYEHLDPRETLAEELYRSIITVRQLDAEIDKLEALHGSTFHLNGKTTGEDKPHITWIMWQEQRKHLLDVSREAHKAGIEAHRLELDHARARVYVMAAVHSMAKMGLTQQQQDDFKRLLAGELRQLETTHAVG